MTAGRLIVPGFFPADDRNGDPVSGAKMYVYENETTTPVDVFSDYDLTTPLENPVIANSAGVWPSIWAEGGTEEVPVFYSVTVAGPTGVVFRSPNSFDNVSPSVDAETYSVFLAESAADSAAASEAQVTIMVDEFLDIVASYPDIPPVINKANISLDNVLGSTFAEKDWPAYTGGTNRSLQDRLNAINILDIAGASDHLKFLTAISQANATGKAIYIPGGTTLDLGANTYPMTAPIRFFGDGDSSVLQRTGNIDSPIIYFNSGSAGYYEVKDLRITTTQGTTPSNSSFNCGICVKNTDNVLIRNVTIDGDVYGFYMGITLDGATNTRVEDVNVFKFANRGIYLYQGCQDILVSGFFIDGSDSGGTARANYGVNTNGSGVVQKRVIVTNGTIRGFISHGASASELLEDSIFSDIIIECSTAATGFEIQFANADRGRKTLISNIRTKGGQFGIQCNKSDNFEIANCHFQLAAVAGIYILDCTNWSVTGGSASYNTSQNILVNGTTADACKSGTFTGVNCSNSGQFGYNIIATVVNGARWISINGGITNNNAGVSVAAQANTDRINVNFMQDRGNGGTVSLLGSNSSNLNPLT